MGQTKKYGLRYPEDTDYVKNTATFFKNLAEDTENVLNTTISNVEIKNKRIISLILKEDTTITAPVASPLKWEVYTQIGNSFEVNDNNLIVLTDTTAKKIKVTVNLGLSLTETTTEISSCVITFKNVNYYKKYINRISSSEKINDISFGDCIIDVSALELEGTEFLNIAYSGVINDIVQKGAIGSSGGYRTFLTIEIIE